MGLQSPFQSEALRTKPFNKFEINFKKAEVLFGWHLNRQVRKMLLGCLGGRGGGVSKSQQQRH
jgi:hypothetical protein